MSTFKLKSVVVETAKVWEGCVLCNHEGIEPSEHITPTLKPCTLCKGAGGKWHAGVYSRQDKVLMVPKKDGCLAREYIPCDKCKSFLRGLTDGGIEFEPCEQCTAGEWEVADD